jgi:hypothetical protein
MSAMPSVSAPGPTTDAALAAQRHAARFPLAVGEQLRGCHRARLGSFTPGRLPRRHRGRLLSEEPHRTPDTRRLDFSVVADVVGEACASAGWAILKCVFWAPLYAIGRAVHGRAWRGGWHSSAGAVLARVLAGARDADFDNSACVLAFTSARLLILDRPADREEFAPFLLAEIPRGVFALRAEPHPARQKDRVDIAFSDGSWLALSLPTSDVPAVERLLKER